MTAALTVTAAVQVAVCPAQELPQVVHAVLAELVAAVPAAVSATVVTVNPARTRLRSWATSGPAGGELVQVQSAVQQGPAFTAAGEVDALVVAGDVWADPRWSLGPDGAVPITSVIAAALPGAGTERAVLTVHGGGPDLTDPSVVEHVARLLPGLAAAVAVARARLEVEGLQVALVSNRRIGAAIGVVMNSQKLTYDAAAALLRSRSNDTNVPLGDLAEAVLFTGELPDLPARPVRAARPRRPVPEC